MSNGMCSTVHITITERNFGKDILTSQAFWEVDVVIDNGDASKCRLITPWDEKSEQDLVWYLEEYAALSGSPFDMSRAGKCHQSLEEYGQKLYNQLRLQDIEYHPTAMLVIDVVGKNYASTIFGIHWEILELKSLWPKFCSTSVRRCFRQAVNIKPNVVCCEIINILLIVARPGIDEIEYLLVAQRLIAAAAHAGADIPRVNVEMVRPGTWAATIAHLERRGDNYFQIVHFDVHGLVIEKGKRQGIYLKFLSADGVNAHFKPAKDVANEIGRRQVHAVILNACRSTSACHSDFYSLPAIFLQTGISMVLGMSMNVSTGAVEKFVTTFYDSILKQPTSWQTAVSASRQVMAADRLRQARFAMTVEVDDWIVPTLYVGDNIMFAQRKNVNTTCHSIESSKLHVDQIRLSSQTKATMPEAEVKALLGRDGTVLELENILLLPFRRVDKPDLWRNHIHIYGRAGVGKTALLRFLCLWWKATGLIDQYVFFDCRSLRPWSTEIMLQTVHEELSGQSMSAKINVDNIVHRFNTEKCLLVIDHLDRISQSDAGATEDMRIELTQFLGLVRESQSFILTGSRNTSEEWLHVPYGLIYPFRLDGIILPYARLLASRLLRTSNRTRLQAQSSEDHELLDLILERVEYFPAAIQTAVEYAVAYDMTLGNLWDVINGRDTVARPLFALSGLGHEIEEFLRQLEIGVLSGNVESVRILGTLYLLSCFQRRFPAQLEPYLVFRRFVLNNRPLLKSSLTESQILELYTCTNAEVMNASWAAHFLPQIQSIFTETVAFLQGKDVLWPEELAADNEQNIRYYHIHPTFSILLQHLVNYSDAVNSAPEGLDIDSLNRAGLWRFYEARFLEFDDSNPTRAALSTEQILSEMDNINAAVLAWLDSWQPGHCASLIIMRLSQFCSVIHLDKLAFRQLQEILKKVTEHFEKLQNTLADNELSANALTTFFLAAGWLQNAYFSIEDWPQVRIYVSSLQRMIAKNSSTVAANPYLQLHACQTNMVSAFEIFSRGAFQDAKKLFSTNINKARPSRMSQTHKVGYAKIEAMNLLGLLRSETHIGQCDRRELQIIMDRQFQATNQYVQLHRILPAGQGHAQDDDLLLESTGVLKDFYCFLRKCDEEGNEGIDCSDELTKIFEPYTRERWNLKQGMWATMQPFAFSKLCSDEFNHYMIILNGLERAYRVNSDTGTFIHYHRELAIVAARSEKWATALEIHRIWSRLVRQKGYALDDQTKALEEGFYSICFIGLKRLSEARRCIERAFQTLENIRADQLKFACLHCLSEIELGAGNSLASLRCLCQAGRLAYAPESDVRWEQPGSILKAVLRSIATGCGLSLGDTKGSEQSALSDVPRTDPIEAGTPPISNQRMKGPNASIGLQKRLNMHVQLIKSEVGDESALRAFLSLLTYWHEYWKADGSFRWPAAEELLFEPTSAPGDKVAPTLPKVDKGGLDQQRWMSQRTLEIPTDQIMNTVQSNTSALEPQSIHDMAFGSQGHREGETESQITVQYILPLLLRFTGILRDERRRTIFWHFCGGEPDFKAMAKAFGQPLPESARTVKLDAASRLLFVKAFLEETDIEAFDDNGTTPLMNAIATSSFEVANFLQSEGADIDALDFHGNAVLHNMVIHQNERALDYCLREGSSIDLKNARGETPLAMAVQRENLHLCTMLINWGANVLSRDNLGLTCPLLAFRARKLENFLLCLNTLDTHDEDVVPHILTDYGFSSTNFVDLLIEQVGDLPDDVRDALLEYSDDFLKGDRAGLTPYHRAVQQSPHWLMALSEDLNADPNKRDETPWGMTPLMCSMIHADAGKNMTILINDNNELRFDMKTLYGNLSALDLFMLHGWDLRIGDRSILKLPSRPRRLMRIAGAWMNCCKVQYYQQFSDKDLNMLAELKKSIVFESSGFSSDEDFLGRAIQELSFQFGDNIISGSEVPVRSPTGKQLSRLAQFASLIDRGYLNRDITMDDSDDAIQVRFEIPWKGNPHYQPQIYHMDRHGRCRYVQPAADRQDEASRVWVVDSQGLMRGVLGAVEFPRSQP